MQIHPLNLDKALLLPRNLVIFLENFEELQLPQSLIFYAEILHTFPTYHCLQKGIQGFLLCLINLVSVSVQKSGLFILANNGRSKQNETTLKNPFEHIGKQETCAKFQQNLTLWQLELNFLDKIPGFSKTVEPCLNSCVGFCIT